MPKQSYSQLSAVVACVFLLSAASGNALAFAVFGFAALICSTAAQPYQNVVFFEAPTAPQNTVFVLALVQMYPPWTDFCCFFIRCYLLFTSLETSLMLSRYAFSTGVKVIS